MQKIVLTFTKDKETKNTARYQEDTEEGMAPKVGTLYVQQATLGMPIPGTLTVTVETT